MIIKQIRSRSLKTLPGIIFDIDGVLMRGGTLIPTAKSAFNNSYKIPIQFVTNSGGLRKHKAKFLKKHLGIPVTEDDIILSHTPLRGQTQLHDKFTLVFGQPPITEVAEDLGFRKTLNFLDLRDSSPYFDMVCIANRLSTEERVRMLKNRVEIPKIEQILLTGEPWPWDTSLQLLLDCLISDGDFWQQKTQRDYEDTGILGSKENHLPIIAANADLLWEAEAPGGRMGHGMFLNILESAYRKFTGKEVSYTILSGKPSQITYEYAEKILVEKAIQQFGAQLGDVYCIGDNIMSDIYGANKYNKHNAKREFKSMLVETGVYHPQKGVGVVESALKYANHAPRDALPLDNECLQPTFNFQNVDQCVELVMKSTD